MRTRLIVIFALLLAGHAQAQTTYQLLFQPSSQFFDDNGAPLAGGKICTYAAGTTTPQSAYTDSTGGTPHTNPIILGADGRPPAGTDIWGGALPYKIVIDYSTGDCSSPIRTIDNVQGTTAASLTCTACVSDAEIDATGITTRTKLPTAIAYEDQANTWTTGAQDMGAATSFKAPVTAAAAPTVSGLLHYDSTANALEYGDNGTNRTVANLDEAQTISGKTFSDNLVFRSGTGFTATFDHAATANRTITLPDLNGTLAYLDNAQTFTGTKTFTNFPLFSAATAGRVPFFGTSGVVDDDDVLTYDDTNNNFKAEQINNVRMVDAFSGANWGAKVAACVADLPATGGTCDARGLEGAQTLTSTLTLSKPVKLIIGKTTVDMTGGATEMILITTAGVEIAGIGWDSVLQVDTATGAGVDAIRVAPTGLAQGLYFHDFRIAPESGTPGRYGINFDNTAQYIQYVKIERIRIDTLGSYALACVNPVPLADGCMATSAIADSMISGGINLANAGDSIRIINNTITGPREILVQMVPGATDQGAHGLLVEGNNITSTGNIRVINGTQGQIVRNNIEATAVSTSANNALIDIDGTAGSRVTAFTIQGNYLGANSAYVADTIRVNYANGTVIRDNMSVGGSGVTYRITANATNTQIRDERQEPYGQLPSAYLSDLGTKSSLHFTYPGSNGFDTILNDLSIGSINRTTNGTTDSKKLVFTGSSYDGSAHVPEWTLFNDVTSNAGLQTFTLQNRLDAGAWSNALQIDSDATNRRLTFSAAGTSILSANGGAVEGALRTDSAGAVFVGALTNHRTDILTNNAVVGSFSTSGNLSLGGLVGGTSQLTLEVGETIGWDNAGAVDTTLARSAAATVKSNGSFVATTAYISNAGDPADAGIVRAGNAETMCWEASPAGTDQCLTVDANERFTVPTMDVQTSLLIGTGTAITKHLSATASLDFTALAASSCETLTVTVTGAADGNVVQLGVPNALADVDGATERTHFYGWVSAADTVSVRRCNPTAGATADPAAATVRASVWQY